MSVTMSIVFKKKLTDRQKIVAFMEALGVKVDEKGKSFYANKMRYYFNDDGELEKIIDYNKD